MCGINGFIVRASDTEHYEGILAKMNDTIIHRGPDSGGKILSQFDEKLIGQGMRRLSIIDVANGYQPMVDAKGRVLTFNGEIYNYKLLRSELVALGHSFRTESDTEVILSLYNEYGVDGFSKLDGMYAISLYDPLDGKVYLLRDRFGEKPLFLYRGSSFVWASELKSIKSYKSDLSIDPVALEKYFQLTYIPSPDCIYKDVEKLIPDTIYTICCKSEVLKRERITRDIVSSFGSQSYGKAKKSVERIVSEAVESRMVADVEVGTFLSGGVDSSIVTALAAKTSSSRLKTFSIGFANKSFDESHFAQEIAEMYETNHSSYVLTQADTISVAHEVLDNFDEPFADSSSLPSYFVSKLAATEVKVALTGDGGDEMFGGYNKYLLSQWNTRYTNFVPKGIHESLRKVSNSMIPMRSDNRGIRFKAKKVINAIDYSGNSYRKICSLGFQMEELQKLFTPKYANLNIDVLKTHFSYPIESLSDMRRIDMITSLEGDMLAKVDRTSMLNSLETRAPFLSPEILDLVESYPDNYFIRNGKTKCLLKDAFEDYFPKGFLSRRKQGFGVPVGDWLRGVFKEELLTLTSEKFIVDQDIFNYKFVNTLVHDHLECRVDNTFRLWTLYCFQRWYVKQF